MIARLAQRLTRLAERYAPDPFVLVLLLTLAVFIMGWGFGASVSSLSTPAALATLGKGWYASVTSAGLMKFALQMCIVLITGHALALSTPVRALIRRLTTLTTSARGAAALVALVAALASLFQWGLGVIVGAFLAREMGRAFAEREQPVHYPLLGAAGYAGFLVWHGGLSGSAPLKVAEPGHFLEKTVGIIPVTATLGSGLNLAVTLSLLLTLGALFWFMTPSDPADMVGYPLDAEPPPADPAADSDDTSAQAPRHPLLHALETGRALSTLTALGILTWLGYLFWMGAVGPDPAVTRTGWQLLAGAFSAWNLDTINALFLALGLLLHRSPTSYASAVADGARGAAGIILQFPFYFGILGVLKASGLIAQIADAAVAASSPTTFPLLTFLSAGFINFLVPSGGGQWAVQGPVVMEAVRRLGASPETSIMALSYGDAWTNMIQPFWALPLLGIMRLQARDIIGYTTVVLLVSGPLIMLWLLVLG